MSDPLQASLLRLSARGISVFSPHTSLDATPDGLNTWSVLALFTVNDLELTARQARQALRI